MGIVVQKYGGTSVADTDKIANVARRAATARADGNGVVVVISAMAGETDRLIGLARSITDEPDAREMDVLVSTGEQVSASLLAITLCNMGVPAISMMGHQARISTDTAHGSARITDIDTERLKRSLQSGKVVVVAGFQGLDDEGDITTLGRGGSDTTAVAVAAALQADSCEIYTDVPGVFTTDPGICPNARKLARISYDEMLELASLGAKVLQTRSVEFAMKYGVPVHVRSSFTDEEGTVVLGKTDSMEGAVVSGVALKREQAAITMKGLPPRPGIAAEVFGLVSDKGINVDVIIQSSDSKGNADLSFTVDEPDFAKTGKCITEAIETLGCGTVETQGGLAKVSLVGLGMRSQHGVAGKMFQALARENIGILMISTSEIKISCIVEGRYAELAVRTVHDAFDLGADSGDVVA